MSEKSVMHEENKEDEAERLHFQKVSNWIQWRLQANISETNINRSGTGTYF